MEGSNKLLIGIGVVTVLIIVIGAFFFGGQSTNQKEAQQEIADLDTSELTVSAENTSGIPNAPVTVIEFADFQCPACASAHPIVKQLLEKYPDEVYYVFRHYPLSIHRNAKIAAQAAESAGEQGKFFEMQDKLFTNQADWQDSGKPKEIFEQYASEIGLDVELYKSQIDEQSGKVNSDFALGNKFQVQSTPTFFINGERYPGVIDLAQFETIIIAANQSNEATPSSKVTHENDASTSEESDQPPVEE